VKPTIYYFRFLFIVMKRILLLAAVSLVLFSCGSNSNPNQGNNVSIQANSLPGFNVNNFANLVKRTSNPTQIESAINAQDNDINNLDLDKDGKVDFLKVVESPNKIQVVDDVNNTDSVTVATLNITPNQTNDRAEMQIQGNPSYCGQDYYYHSSFGLGDMLLLSYMLSPHRYYYPMYHYGYYPSYYHRYGTSSYRTVTHTYSPSAGSGSFHPSANTRSSLSSPVHSQRSFSARDASSPVRSGGFGNRSSSSNSSSTPRSSSFGSGSSSGRSTFGSGGSSFGSHRSSFGGGRSGFGRRR